MDRRWIPRGLRLLARLAWDLRERTLLRRCAAVVAATDRVADRYRPLHRNVVTVANYPDLSDLEAVPANVRDETTCVYAGTILPNRGLMEVMEALAILQKKGLDVKLSLAGNGSKDYLRVLFDRAEQLGVSSRVSYAGVLSRQDALLLQSRAGIGLVPGLPVGNNLAAVPVKMVECMALGLPVVFSDFPSHQEVAGEYQAGTAVNPTSPAAIAGAIENLVSHPALAREMGERGRRAVHERFNWSSERAKLLGLYEKILSPARTDELSVTPGP
jgi:glycosyltransferase involved in cell wall biosynthesis